MICVEVLSKKIRTIFISLFLIIVAISCSKTDDNTDNTDTEPEHILLEQIPEHIIMYEVNIRVFSSEGDLAGVTSRLDQIGALGVNVLWLMPIFPIGQLNSVNSPYCVQNYTEVNPEFGTFSDLLVLVDSAHSKDMAVILDWVANHTAWDNPWIENDSWYTQVNGEIIHPEGTNWQDVADLNYDNNEMRLAMIDALNFWIQEANIDGYRFDAADFVPFDFWQQALNVVDSATDRELIFLAEGARADHFTAGFQMNFSWNFYNQMKNVYNGQPATLLYTTHITEYQNIPAGKNKLRFTTNHDESAWDATPITLFNEENGALTASVITIYMGGVPLIYGSQEVGIAETIPFFSNYPINWEQNPDMYQTYQDILNFYLNSEALLEGELQDYSTNDVVCFTRTSATEEVLVIANIRDTAIEYDIPSGFQNTSWSDGFSGQPLTLETSIPLNGYSYSVLMRGIE